MFGGGVAKPAEKSERRSSSREPSHVGEDQPDSHPPRPSSTQTPSAPALLGAVEDVSDRLPPLPRINPGLARRQSQERLRLDGLDPAELRAIRSPPASPKRSPKSSPNGTRRSPPLDRVLQEEMGGGPGGVSLGVWPRGSPSPKMRKTASVYSPLVVSSDAKHPPGAKDASPAKDRPVSAPSPQQNTEASSLYMNSANLPHLNHLWERHQREEAEKAGLVITALLKEPRITGPRVPIEFQGQWLTERGKAYAWKQRVGGIM